MEDQCVLVGLEAANHRIDRAVAMAEDIFHLGLDGFGVGDGGLGVVVETGTSPAGVALGEMVGDQHEGLAAGPDGVAHMVGEDLVQVGPAQVEHPTQVAEGLDDARRRAGGHGDVDASVHALECHDVGGMDRQVALAGQEGLRTGVVLRVMVGDVESQSMRSWIGLL